MCSRSQVKPERANSSGPWLKLTFTKGHIRITPHTWKQASPPPGWLSRVTASRWNWVRQPLGRVLQLWPVTAASVISPSGLSPVHHGISGSMPVFPASEGPSLGLVRLPHRAHPPLCTFHRLSKVTWHHNSTNTGIILMFLLFSSQHRENLGMWKIRRYALQKQLHTAHEDFWNFPF